MPWVGWVNQPCGFWEVISGSGGRVLQGFSQSPCSSRRPRHLAAQEVPRARWPRSPSNHSTSCTARAACSKVAHGRARGSEEVGPRNLQLGHQICLWINTAKLKSIYSKYYFKRDEHNFASYLDVHTGLDSQPFWIQDWVVKKSSGKGARVKLN